MMIMMVSVFQNRFFVLAAAARRFFSSSLPLFLHSKKVLIAGFNASELVAYRITTR
jgi:hypothetical protein